jgi:CDP-diglyceride synthetase
VLLHRVLTALVGVPVVLACIWFGPPWITLLAAVAAVIGVREAYRLYPDHGRISEDHDGGDTPLPLLLGGTWAVALVLAGELAVRPEDFGWAVLGICVAGVVVGGLWMIAAWHGRRPVAAASYLVMSPVYVGGALASATALRGIDGIPTLWHTKVEEPPPLSVPSHIEDDGLGEAFESVYEVPADAIGVWLLPDLAGSDFAWELTALTETGCWWLLLAILTVYAADTGAYAVGRLLGRHRMAPGISPGKTWEGTAGGMLFAVIAAVVLGMLFPLRLEIWHLAIIGVILGAVSPIGDLVESKIKRLADAKDSGNLFPGHGGMLDRLDSLLPSLIVVYILAAVSTP